MSFQGFTEKTHEYFLSICLDNTKSNFEANRQIYNAHVRDPMRALHKALIPVMLEIDGTIVVRQSRCISGAYNDARFAKSDPVKTYMYLHFFAGTNRETDIPGFFMDASYDGYRYGLQLYRRTTQGMTRLRDAALANGKRFSEIIGAIEKDGFFILEGDSFKRDRFPDAPQPMKSWLNKKSWWLGRTCPPDSAFFSPDLAGALSEGFMKLRPLYLFIAETFQS